MYDRDGPGEAPHIGSLVSALTSQSLANPLYFASRGIGFIDDEPYIVKSEVYISGLGADE